MFGIIIGAAAALGTVAYLRRRRYYARHYGRHYGRHHGHRWQGHRGYGCAGPGCGPYDDYAGPGGYAGDEPGWGRGPWSFAGGSVADRWASMLAWRLEASPSQSEVIRAAFHAVHDELRTLADERKATRDDLGKALGGERFDEQVMGELFARHDQRLEQLRRAIVGALAKVHDVLEPVQRERLAALIGRRGFGPYRA